MTERVLNHTKHIQGNRDKLDNEHWYDNVLKLDDQVVKVR
jgi:hypothetical protein